MKVTLFKPFRQWFLEALYPTKQQNSHIFESRVFQNPNYLHIEIFSTLCIVREAGSRYGIQKWKSMSCLRMELEQWLLLSPESSCKFLKWYSRLHLSDSTYIYIRCLNTTMLIKSMNNTKMKEHWWLTSTTYSCFAKNYFQKIPTFFLSFVAETKSRNVLRTVFPL